MGKNKKTKPTETSVEPNERYVLFGFLSLILLHVVGGFWNSYYSWGFSYWSLFPIYIVGILGVVALFAVWKSYTIREELSLNFLKSLQFSNKSKQVQIVMYAALGVFVFAFLYLFRSKALIYGDGYSILDFCSTQSPLEISGQIYLQLLSVYWHQFMFKMLSIFPILTPENIFALTNVFSGIIGLWAIWSIANVLHSQQRNRNFIFIVALSSAAIILFFGYIENYTTVYMAGLWSLRYMIGYVKKKNGILPLIIFTTLALALHLISFPFLLAAIYAILLRAGWLKFNKSVFVVSVMILLGSIGVVFFAQIKGSSVFVPLWSITDNSYSLLSLNHISDLLNQLIFIAPLSLLFLVVPFLQKQKINYCSDDSQKILYMLSYFTILSAVFIDPQLGAARDWDLLAFYGIPLSIYGGYTLTTLYKKREIPKWIVLASCVIVIIHIVPNIYEKNNTELAVEHLDEILWDDPHYQTDYQDAFRGTSWGYILQKNLNRYDLSEKYFVRRREAYSSDPSSSYNLGVLYSGQGKNEEAKHYLKKGIEIDSHDAKLFSKLAEVEFNLRNYKDSEKYARESVKLDSNYIPGLTALALVLKREKKYDEALVYFRKAYELAPNEYQVLFNMGTYYARGIDGDSAFYYLQKAEPLADENQKVHVLKTIVSVALHIRRNDEALKFYNKLKPLVPESFMMKELKKQIDKKLSD